MENDRIEANRIYDSFSAEKRNMSRRNFVQQYLALLSPAGIQRDLSRIQQGRENQRQIDSAIT